MNHGLGPLNDRLTRPTLGAAQEAAQIAKESFATGKTVRQIAQERRVLPEDRLDELLDPRRMTEPGLIAGPAGG